jgi:hypothetical protein
MDMDLNKAASELLKTPAGAKLAGKKDDLQKLINSPEGQNVKNMLSGDSENLKAAIAGGDMETLKNTLAQILKTEDGAKLATQIQNLMK